jgi:aspartate--ammonia ligase
MSQEERKTLPIAGDNFLTKMKAINISRSALFESLETDLNLIRVSAPLFIPVGTGIQDTLFKVPSKIKFEHTAIPGCTLETLHSLAKWKRHILTEHSVSPYAGIYVEGHYVRGYEPVLDETHSVYVLQFDWEIVI